MTPRPRSGLGARAVCAFFAWAIANESAPTERAGGIALGGGAAFFACAIDKESAPTERAGGIELVGLCAFFAWAIANESAPTERAGGIELVGDCAFLAWAIDKESAPTERAGGIERVGVIERTISCGFGSEWFGKLACNVESHDQLRGERVRRCPWKVLQLFRRRANPS